MSRSESDATEADDELSARILALVGEVEGVLTDGRALVISPVAAQALLAAGCKTYAAQMEAGADAGAVSRANAVTATDIMVTASGLLKSADLAVFELGLWQGWTGR